jgi:hypothetical protein
MTFGTRNEGDSNPHEMEMTKTGNGVDCGVYRP